MWYLTERIETPFAAFNFFLGGGRESSVSVLLCLTLEVGLRGMPVLVSVAVVTTRSADDRVVAVTLSKHVIR